MNTIVPRKISIRGISDTNNEIISTLSLNQGTLKLVIR
jgi:hypothetical protein